MPLAHIQEKSSDQSFLMPARIFNPRQEEPDRIEVPMIIDTGSARTAIPQRAYLQLTSRVPLLYGLTNMKMKSPLMPEETISTPSYIVILEFQLGEHTKTHEVEVFTISRDYGIIGRDTALLTTVRDSRIPSLPCLPSLFCPRWIPKTLYY
jgi:hypothetical protein